MNPPPPFSHPVRIGDLAARKVTPFEVIPPPEALAAIAADLGIDALRKVRFQGELAPKGAADWLLTARLGATVVQPCVVTLAPVTTRIEEPVVRTYLARMPALTDTEVELEDDTLEPLGAVIDLGAVLTEALALALPAYPRAPGVAFGAATFTESGEAAFDDKIRPFASLRDKLGPAEGGS